MILPTQNSSEASNWHSDKIQSSFLWPPRGPMICLPIPLHSSYSSALATWVFFLSLEFTKLLPYPRPLYMLSPMPGMFFKSLDIFLAHFLNSFLLKCHLLRKSILEYSIWNRTPPSTVTFYFLTLLYFSSWHLSPAAIICLFAHLFNFCLYH